MLRSHTVYILCRISHPNRNKYLLTLTLYVDAILRPPLPLSVAIYKLYTTAFVPLGLHYVVQGNITTLWRVSAGPWECSSGCMLAGWRQEFVVPWHGNQPSSLSWRSMDRVQGVNPPHSSIELWDHNTGPGTIMTTNEVQVQHDE